MTRIASMDFPPGKVCTFCKSKQSCVWCSDCGPLAYFCGECTNQLHSTINVFHCPLLWKVSSSLQVCISNFIICHHFTLSQDDINMYTPFPRSPYLDVICNCSTQYTRDIKCVNEKGMWFCIEAHSYIIYPSSGNFCSKKFPFLIYV